MSYFAPYLDETGIHMPTYNDWMEYLITGYKQIFGADVYLGEDSQDYQMLSLFAKSMDDANALMLDVYSSMNPNWATGVSLDRHLAFSGITRNRATYSTVSLALTGTAEASLPAGLLAKDTAGRSWRIGSSFTFDASGNATVQAACTQAGAIIAAAGTIQIIETPRSTWYTVNNPADATPGRDTETDAAARVRRAESMGLSALGTLSAIHSSLINLPGVDHVSVLENYGDTINANGLPPHSVCALVLGGNADQIATQVFKKKAPGIATYGNTTRTVIDDYGNSNTVKFSRPVNTPLYVNISLRALPGWDGNYMVADIKDNVIAYLESIGIGDSLIVSALWGEVFKATEGTAPAFSILSITAGTQSGQGQSADTVAATYDTKFYTDAEHITVTVTGA